MKKKYYVSVKIGDYKSPESEITATFKDLFALAKSLVRYGKRHEIKTRVLIRDYDNYDALLRMFSRESVTSHKYIAKLSHCCKYGRGRKDLFF